MPVRMDIIIAVPRSALALGVASLLVVAYHVVACLLLPEELWLAEAVRTATGASVRRRAAMEHPRTARLLRPLTWMRAGYWVLLVTVCISACSIGTAVWLALQDTGVDPEAYDYWEHYRPYKEAGDEPPVKDTNPSVVAIVAAGLVAQLLLAVAWNVCCWGAPLHRGQTVLNATPDFNEQMPGPAATAARASPWRQVSREQAQRSLLIVAIMVQLIPVVNSGHSLGWALVAVVWSVNLGALVGVMILVRDHPSGFEDLEEKPMFGLVLLASDLEAALARRLEEDEAADEEKGAMQHHMQPAACCGAHICGCPACQRLLRRFPATLGRMQRTLAISYRWQPVSRVIAHHEGVVGGLAPSAGVKDGMAGLNMTPWQMRELLVELRRGRHSYVWLDALSIPAAVLGWEGKPGTWLQEVSDKLLVRMMAVYAAANQILVLKSREDEGGRYHQRGWTLQEYCGARNVTERVELAPDGSAAPDGRHLGRSSSMTIEEVETFRILRSGIMQRMEHALPVWLQMLARAENNNGGDGDSSLLEGVLTYAEVNSKIVTAVPADKIRALVPLLLNSPVEGDSELKELVSRAMGAVRAMPNPSSEVVVAMQEACQLIGCDSGPRVETPDSVAASLDVLLGKTLLGRGRRLL